MMGAVSASLVSVTTLARQLRTRTLMALAGALLLAGCSTGPFDHAATVNGQLISESDLQEAVAQINTQVATTPADVLGVLIKAPVLDELAQGAPFEVSEQQMVEAIRTQTTIENPSPLLVDYVRADYYLRQLGGVIPPEELAELDVELNPRYGTWDPTAGDVVNDVPAWINPVEAQDAGS